MKSEKIIPWRLIFFIAIILVLIFFVGFNLDNRTNISFGFVEISEIPSALLSVFSLFFGLILGIVITLLTTKKTPPMSKNDKKEEKEKKKNEKKKKKKNQIEMPSGEN